MDKAPDAFRTISEVADELDVPQHVLRFWETRFGQIRPMKRGGGRRYYRPEDVDLLRGIRHLLYGEGYTIRGVQRLLKDNGAKFVQGVGRSESPAPPPQPDDVATEDEPPFQATAQSDDDNKADEPSEAELEAPAPVEPSSSLPARAVVMSRANQAPAAPTAAVVATPPAAVPQLSRHDIQRLQAALYELGECRRLLDAAMSDD